MKRIPGNQGLGVLLRFDEVGQLRLSIGPSRKNPGWGPVYGSAHFVSLVSEFPPFVQLTVEIEAVLRSVERRVQPR
jgi:hypothetical protein